MRLFPLLFVVLVLPMIAEKTRKPPEINVSELAALRKDELIEIEATFRNPGPKPLNGLEVSFNFFTGDHHPVSTQRAKADETLLNTGDESQIHAQMADAVRAVTLEITATDGSGRELRVGQAGPYPIQ
jgi:hypothetical protein